MEYEMIDKDTADLIRRLEDLIEHLKTGRINSGDWWIKKLVKIICRFEEFLSPHEPFEQHENISKRAVEKQVAPTVPIYQEEYQPHELFLIIPSNRLDESIQKNKPIQTDMLNRMIGKAKFGYAYAKGDAEGEKRAANLAYLTDAIDYTRTDAIVLHLSVLAKTAITSPKADKLAIERAIKPGVDAQVIRVQKRDVLGQALTGTGFHTIA